MIAGLTGIHAKLDETSAKRLGIDARQAVFGDRAADDDAVIVVRAGDTRIGVHLGIAAVSGLIEPGAVVDFKRIHAENERNASGKQDQKQPRSEKRPLFGGHP